MAASTPSTAQPQPYDTLRLRSSARPFRGSALPPGDKSLSHRALLFSAMASGRSVITNLSEGSDVVATRRALGALGVRIEALGRPGSYAVESRGVGDLREPSSVIDVGNSGTLIRLLSGLVAGVDGHTVLSGDASVNRRPMGRITTPLRAMGAAIDGRSGGELAPLSIRGRELQGIRYHTPVASAQIKSAILLGGVQAEGETWVVEEVLTRRHTEEFLGMCGVSFEEVLAKDGTHSVGVSRPSLIRPFAVTVPVDPSQAAFWLVAAILADGSEVTVESCYSGSARVGFIEALAEMGGEIEVTTLSETGDDESSVVASRAGVAGSLPTASISARSSKLRALSVRGSRVSTMIDEIPILVVAALFAEGRSVFSNLGELAVKESNRIESTVALAQAFGGDVEMHGDTITVHGSAGFVPRATTVDARGDHRIAMSGAILAAMVPGGAVTTISGFGSVATSYPGFLDDLTALTEVEIELL